MTPKRKPARDRYRADVTYLQDGKHCVGLVRVAKRQAATVFVETLTVSDPSGRELRRFIAGIDTGKDVKPKPAPLPRAVRELLRDVVLLDQAAVLVSYATTAFKLPNQYTVSERAARILGTTPGDIVAKARKAGRR